MAPPSAKQKSVSDANFIRVKYGEAREAILNTNCRCCHLLESVKKACGCDEKDEIELIGGDGQLLGLSEPDRELCYAEGFVQSRAVYYAVLVKIDQARPSPQYVPLLKNMDSVNPELALKLHDMSNPNAKAVRQAWKSVGKKGVEVQRQREGVAADVQPLAGRRSGTLKALLSRAQAADAGEKKNSFIRLVAAASAAVAANSPRAAA